MLLVSSRFGPRVHPVTLKPSFHTGVDFAIPSGTATLTPVPGLVTRLDVDGQEKGVINGNAVHLRAGKSTWSFLHLSAFGPQVRVGATLPPGGLVGWSGNTGRSTGPHLHLSVRIGEEYVDPLQFFPPNSWRLL